jgi:hypothetical protein
VKFVAFNNYLSFFLFQTSMKNWISISLHLLLWLVFLATPASDAYACGKTCCSKPETIENQPIKQEESSKCGSECAQKCHHSHKKDSKKGCGDDCNCSTTVVMVADLPQKINFVFYFKTNFVEKCFFLYQQACSKSVIYAVWQPPITFLA